MEVNQRLTVPQRILGYTKPRLGVSPSYQQTSIQ